MNTPNYYSILPAKVRYHKELTASEKLFYSELTALCNIHGYVEANDEYFSTLYNVDASTVRRWIKKLKNYKLIKVKKGSKIHKRKRVIKIQFDIFGKKVNVHTCTKNGGIHAHIDNKEKAESDKSSSAYEKELNRRRKLKNEKQ